MTTDLSFASPGARRMPGAWILGLAALAGCSAGAYVREADEEAYRILEEKRAPALGPEAAAGRGPFSIDAPADSLRKRLDADIASGKRPAISLSLPQALETAAGNSREFQARKEALYLSALGLTGTRNRYAFLWTGSAGASISGEGDDATSAAADGDIGVSHILATGGQVLANFALGFVKNLLLGGDWDGSSVLALSITQPLLRGAGREVALEPLTQGERSVVYAVRDYERFRSTFAVRIVDEYLGVLEQENSLANNEANYQSLKDSYERTERLGPAFAGRIPQFEVDQARQQLLSAEDSKLLAQARFKTAVDRFKLTLGLPVDIDLELDKTVLDTFRDLGVSALKLAPEEAVALALERRLDLRNRRERLEDSARQVRIAEQNLLLDLGLRASASVPNEDPSKPLKLAWDRVNWEAGLDADLPLNRVPERNAFRSALIAHEAERRELEAEQDRITQVIRSALVDLDQAWRSYRIQVLAVELAAQRVDMTKLQLEAGRSRVRDYLESQQALLSSRNALTSALVGYVNTKLGLLRDLELLDPGPTGLDVDLTALRRWTE